MAVLDGFKKANSPADEGNTAPTFEEHQARVAAYQDAELRKTKNG